MADPERDRLIMLVREADCLADRLDGGADGYGGAVHRAWYRLERRREALRKHEAERAREGGSSN